MCMYVYTFNDCVISFTPFFLLFALLLMRFHFSGPFDGTISNE